MSENQTAERLPIHDRDAERAVLGAVLRSNAAIDDVSQIIKPKDFYLYAHQQIFQAMLELREAGTPVDPVTVFDAICQAEKLADIGGAAYLAELYDSSPNPANAAHHATIVIDKATLRELEHLVRAIQTDTHQNHGPVDFLLSQAIAQIQDLAERRTKNELISGARRAALPSTG